MKTFYFLLFLSCFSVQLIFPQCPPPAPILSSAIANSRGFISVSGLGADPDATITVLQNGFPLGGTGMAGVNGVYSFTPTEQLASGRYAITVTQATTEDVIECVSGPSNPVSVTVNRFPVTTTTGFSGRRGNRLFARGRAQPRSTVVILVRPAGSTEQPQIVGCGTASRSGTFGIESRSLPSGTYNIDTAQAISSCNNITCVGDNEFNKTIGISNPLMIAIGASTPYPNNPWVNALYEKFVRPHKTNT